MDKTYEWFLEADLSEYEGKYIAIIKENLFFAGDDPEELYKKAQKEYPDHEIVLWKVPSGDTLIFSTYNENRET
ncbi:MAG: succinyl-CoA synthetase subunit alpha [Deltaproteobacteria bacterium]|nr:succinyl-CoA synthetase subunit alpha [Deltaproteobacteria bacterium]RLB30084.1 MAG: succinyl-CoA synthetase subunit alpha [Deltaproteobacteria bacterium]